MIIFKLTDCQGNSSRDNYANNELEYIIKRIESFVDGVSDYTITIKEN
jgi:hypothetical protein